MVWVSRDKSGVRPCAEPVVPTHCFVYRSVMRRCRRVTPSVSRAEALMNGWSPGTIARFGSFLFCSFSERDVLPRCTRNNKRTTHPWVRNTPRLYQDDLLQELDGGKLHTCLRIGCPHELDDPALRARERVPLRSLVSVRASVRKRCENISANDSEAYQKSKTHSQRKRSGYAPASVCTAILTVQGLLSLRRPASMSRDRDATKGDNTKDGVWAHLYVSRVSTGQGYVELEKETRTLCTRIDRQRCSRDTKM